MVDFFPLVYDISDMVLFAKWTGKERVLCKYARRVVTDGSACKMCLE